MAEHGHAGRHDRPDAAVVDHHDRADRAEGVQRGSGIVVPHRDHDGHVGRAVALARRSGVGGAGVEQPVDERLARRDRRRRRRRWRRPRGRPPVPAGRWSAASRRRAAGRRRGGGPCGRATSRMAQAGQAATAAPSAVASSSSSRGPLGGGGAGRIAEHPAGRRPRRPRRPRSAGRIVASGAVQPGCGEVHPHRSPVRWRGATRSRPGRRVRRRPAPTATRPAPAGPRAAACATARSTASALPPCPLTRTTPAKWSADRTSSTSDVLERGRARSRACRRSPRARRWPRTRAAGATRTSSRRRASSEASATAMGVSVSSGRCGPCCSQLPRGTASSGRTEATSGHAWRPRDVTAPGSPTPAQRVEDPVRRRRRVEHDDLVAVAAGGGALGERADPVEGGRAGGAGEHAGPRAERAQQVGVGGTVPLADGGAGRDDLDRGSAGRHHRAQRRRGGGGPSSPRPTGRRGRPAARARAVLGPAGATRSRGRPARRARRRPARAPGPSRARRRGRPGRRPSPGPASGRRTRPR